MCPREGPRAKSRLAIQIDGIQPLNFHRTLPISELPSVEIVSRLDGVRPTDENIVKGLHQTLPFNDTATETIKGARSKIHRVYGLCCWFHLQE